MGSVFVLVRERAGVSVSEPSSCLSWRRTDKVSAGTSVEPAAVVNECWVTQMCRKESDLNLKFFHKQTAESFTIVNAWGLIGRQQLQICVTHLT